MVNHLSGWLDYDRPSLYLLGPDERIDYFEKRVRLVVVNPLHRILNNEIHIAPDSSALLIFGVSLCCAIEATGKFVMGVKIKSASKNSDRFHKFLNDYMAPEYKPKADGGCDYGQTLWQHFCNGLAHGFAVCHGGFEGNRGEPYFKVRKIAGCDSLLVNPYLLFDDYLVGFGRYLSALRVCQPTDQLSINFSDVFKSVFIDGR
jgi:hypothetical protein